MTICNRSEEEAWKLLLQRGKPHMNPQESEELAMEWRTIFAVYSLQRAKATQTPLRKFSSALCQRSEYLVFRSRWGWVWILHNTLEPLNSHEQRLCLCSSGGSFFSWYTRLKINAGFGMNRFSAALRSAYGLVAAPYGRWWYYSNKCNGSDCDLACTSSRQMQLLQL